MTGALERLTQADRLLAEAVSITDHLNVIDFAEAARVFAREAKLGTSAINHATAVKIRAEIRLANMVDAGQQQGSIAIKGQHGSSPESGDEGVATLASLDVDTRRLLEARRLRDHLTEDEVIARAMERSDLGRELSRDGLLVEALYAKRNAKRAEQVQALRAEPPALPTGPFRLIVADPPWDYDVDEDKVNQRWRSNTPYPGMSIEDITNMKVRDIAADDSVLWLWTTNTYLRDAFDVMVEWGFTYRVMLTWAKDKFGLGHWLRGQTEHCLLGTRGTPAWHLTNQSTLLSGPMRNHSQKPDEFWDFIEALHPASAGNRCELFSRSPREGWVSFGDEATQ